MLNQLWNFIVDLKYAERYYWHYSVSDSYKDSAIAIICALTSASSIATWLIWKEHPLLWAIIIGAAQVISIIRPYFWFSKRSTPARYMAAEFAALLVNAELYWTTHSGSDTNQEISQKLSDLSRQYEIIESRFSSGLVYPKKKKIFDLAQTDVATYFTTHYNLSRESITYE